MNAWDIDPFYQLGTWTELWQAVKKAVRPASAGENTYEDDCCPSHCCGGKREGELA